MAKPAAHTSNPTPGAPTPGLTSGSSPSPGSSNQYNSLALGNIFPRF